MKRLAALLLSLLLLLPSALAGADPMVRAGGAFCLALDAQGQLWGWGETSRGQLGIGRGNKIYRPVPALLGLDGSQIREIACGNVNTLILMQDGTVWTCGGNDYGQQGLGDRKAHVKEPEPIPSLQHIVQIACGWGQCLALTEDGQVYAWGRNSNGQLGTGERRSENVPTLLTLKGITHIHCGGK